MTSFNLSDFTVRVVRPAGSTGPFPVILYLPGGGFREGLPPALVIVADVHQNLREKQ
jgi:acetyl esterase/lipase